MPAYLLDTSVALRFCDASSPNHLVAIEGVSRLLARGENVYLTAQNIIEFWAVATRPLEVNGFGWSVEKTAEEVETLLSLFLFLEDSPAIFRNWLQLVSTGSVKGKRVHDARLIAVMKAHSVTNLVTFNTEDFTRYTEITTVHPASIK